jgi:hypothetical protein
MRALDEEGRSVQYTVPPRRAPIAGQGCVRFTTVTVSDDG